MRAWFAAPAGTTEAERLALERRLNGRPADSRPWSGWPPSPSKPARPTSWLRSGPEGGGSTGPATLRALIATEAKNPTSPTSWPGLAESLGREFEARGWWTLRADSVRRPRGPRGPGPTGPPLPPSAPPADRSPT